MPRPIRESDLSGLPHPAPGRGGAARARVAARYGVPVGRWVPVSSSWIRALMHDGSAGHMLTRAGDSYDYPGMPLADFAAWLAAPSHGAWYGLYVRGRYG